MILRTTNQGSIEHRSFALTDMLRYGYNGLRNFTPGINEQAARGVPALHRAARLRAEAIAGLELCCWSGTKEQRQRRDNVWQARLFSRRPNYYQTTFAFWETVGESLAWRNNAYIWKMVDPLAGMPPITARVTDWWALHPDQVVCSGAGEYTVTVSDGYVDPVGRGNAKYTVDEATILHIRGHGDGGKYEAPTPIQVFRDAMTAPVLRQRHENKMWTKGHTLQLAVEFPQGVKKAEADVWKEDWRRTMEGAAGDTTAVVGGGAVIKPIGMTAADAQFVDMAKLTVDDASRIMGVPANLLGAQLERSVPNLEQDLAMWLRFGFGPDLGRIESALGEDNELFGGAQTYPMFDTETFVRGDAKTEDDVAHQQVQDGRLLVDEWRESKGLPPLPNGAGKVPQVVPVGGGANPNSGGTSEAEATAAA